MDWGREEGLMRAPGLHTLYPCASCPLQKGRGLCWRPAKGKVACGHLLLWDSSMGPVGVRERVFVCLFCTKAFLEIILLKDKLTNG